MNIPKSRRLDMALEVVVIPVADVDRALRFYGSLGWRLDADIKNGADFRLIQFTPPGSPCSIQFGSGVTHAASGSEGGLYLVVSDIHAAHQQLADCGVEVGEVFHRSSNRKKVMGQDPQRRSYASFFAFGDPDGNSWLVQEVTARLPGRSDPEVVTFRSVEMLATALRRAAAAHGEHEKQIGRPDTNWPDWYAEYILREQTKPPV